MSRRAYYLFSGIDARRMMEDAMRSQNRAVSKREDQDRFILYVKRHQQDSNTILELLSRYGGPEWYGIIIVTLDSDDESETPHFVDPVTTVYGLHDVQQAIMDKMSGRISQYHRC